MTEKTVTKKAGSQPRKTAGAKRAVSTANDAAGQVAPSEKIDRHIAGISDWRGPVLADVRHIMLQADPAVTEDWKWMGSPVWYCDGMIALANAHRDKVKVTFSKGAHFADPEHVFNAGLGGNDWRAIDIAEKDQLDQAALRRLVKAAIEYNRSQQKTKEQKTKERKRIVAITGKRASRAVS